MEQHRKKHQDLEQNNKNHQNQEDSSLHLHQQKLRKLEEECLEAQITLGKKKRNQPLVQHQQLHHQQLLKKLRQRRKVICLEVCLLQIQRLPSAPAQSAAAPQAKLEETNKQTAEEAEKLQFTSQTLE